MSRDRERCDVVVVGARCAGAAAASHLARAGHRVVALDRARFPSDTLSTHVFFPSGVDELRRIGALEAILDLEPPRLQRARIELLGLAWWESFRPIGGSAFGVCVPRDMQDEVLVETARANGADVREGCRVTQVLWRGGRACGVRYTAPGGAERELAAELVIGADGRRSTVAAEVGAWRPYRLSRNGRGLVWRYMDDPHADGWPAGSMWQWRDGDSVAMAFPCAPRNRLLILMMGPREEVPHARSDPDAYWARTLARHPGCARRCAGATNQSKLRSTADTSAYFRASSGPGWALIGDAGHFKDPIIGQGMRDAMWMGRTLAEAVAPVLGDPCAVDAASRRWELERDLECLPAYHWGNAETRVRAPSPILRAVLDELPIDGAYTLTDAFARVRSPQEVLTLPTVARAAARALRDRGPGLLADLIGDFAVELRVRAEARARPFRRRRPLRGSEHPGASWPDPPRRPQPAATASPAQEAVV